MTQAENARFRSRRFFLTFWQEIPNIIEHPGLIYGCQCFDQTTEEHGGKFHGHAFLYFKNAISVNTVKKHYGNDCHNEAIKTKSNSECINYIMNPEHKHAAHKFNRLEVGEKPCDNGHHFTTEQALKMEDYEILELNPRDAAVIYNLKEKLRCSDLNVKTTKKNMNVIYICGPSDIGKSRRALDLIEEIEPTGNYASVKFDGQFWHGVKDSKSSTCLYDEWRDYKMRPDEFINFIDYNKHPINVKNGEKINEFTNIIITTTQHPYFIYKNSKEQPKQWFKRFKLWNLYDPNNSEHVEIFRENNGADIEELEEITEEDRKKLMWSDFQ